MRPIFVHLWMPFGIQAMMLWPFIVIRVAVDDFCLRQHELYHWRQARRWGVLPWYVAYLILGLFYIGKPADAHPLERRAYAVERKCREVGGARP